MLRLTALVTPARSLVGALRQCVRFESSGNSRNWNLRAPDGWIYARHLKHKYGKRYITKQEWARQNGTWKGARRPHTKQRTCYGRTTTEPPPAPAGAGRQSRKGVAVTKGSVARRKIGFSGVSGPA